MDQFGEPKRWEPKVRTLQIVVPALCLGPVVFLMAALATGRPNQPANMAAAIYVMMGCAGACVVARAVVPDMIVRSGIEAVRQHQTLSDPERLDKLVGLYFTRTVVAATLIESAGLLFAVAYFLQPSAVSLVATLVMVAGVALHFPTVTQVEHWIEWQSR